MPPKFDMSQLVRGGRRMAQSDSEGIDLPDNLTAGSIGKILKPKPTPAPKPSPTKQYAA